MSVWDTLVGQLPTIDALGSAVAGQGMTHAWLFTGPPGSGRSNAALAFDRTKARGFRLNIAAGTAVRFEPGQSRTVELVALAGARVVYGFTGAVMGPLDAKVRANAARRSPAKMKAAAASAKAKGKR